ncbi:MAG: ion transporter [Flavobacteriales bacterium]|nr:ion transporter [Flavobacteriales bacterium]
MDHGNGRVTVLKRWLYRIVFGTDTPLGKLFDVVLLWAIVISVVFVMLESVAELRERYGLLLHIFEWFFTILFTLEYLLRLWIVEKPIRYAKSFFGVIDLLSILPTYLAAFLPGAHGFMVLRTLRLLRVFRVLKLVRYISEAGTLARALAASRRKILVFLSAVLALVIVFGTIMYLVESPEAGFTSIPRSIYWAIVTLTTVGYGDIAPQSVLGQFIASVIMILGYAIIAVPTGIVGVEMSKLEEPGVECPTCHTAGHRSDANYCRRCGQELAIDRTERPERDRQASA